MCSEKTAERPKGTQFIRKSDKIRLVRQVSIELINYLNSCIIQEVDKDEGKKCDAESW